MRSSCHSPSGVQTVRISAQHSSAGQTSAVQSEVYSAPLEIIHDKPYVSVMVNGRGPFRFLIDTGTGGQALVTPELAEELLLPVAGVHI